MKIYKNKCPICSAPSKNNKEPFFCSNTKCKSWRAIRKQMAELNLPKLITIGDTSDDPIKVCCLKCNIQLDTTGYCLKCHKISSVYNYEINKWYEWKSNDGIYIYRYVGAPNHWDWDNKIIRMV